MKSNFLAGREEILAPPAELAVVNHQCAQWLADINNRIHGTTHQPPVKLLAEERSQLLPLPPHPYDIARQKPIYADRQAFVHFESNLYSVPPETLNQLWTSIGAKYQPSVMYRARLVTIQDREPSLSGPPVTDVDFVLHDK